eukprot:171622-Prorocentrum_lima.AAC.1
MGVQPARHFVAVGHGYDFLLVWGPPAPLHGNPRFAGYWFRWRRTMSIGHSETRRRMREGL